jgi:putative FmdB family regulatory protein
MPIYEYRCPEGHTFERFQSMTAPSPERCDVCDASPVEVVLYPVAIHYKGSGFYSTDYGKSKAKKEGDSGSSEPSKTETKSSESKSSESKSSESKPASSPQSSSGSSGGD